jgi:hypothetical protein
MVTIPQFDYDAGIDKATINLSVANIGSAAFQAPFYVTVYKNNSSGSPKLVYTHNAMIYDGDTVNMSIVIPNFKTSGWMPFDHILVRTNDNGNSYTNQAVCDSALITRDFTTTSIIAIDDRVMVNKNSSNNRITVSVNDLKPCSDPTVEIITGGTPQHGTASVTNDSVIVYTPATDYLGGDTIIYRIYCNDVAEADTAKVYIVVIEFPDNVAETDCAVPVSSMTWSINTTPEMLGGNMVSVYQTAYVGDLDGNGDVEIVVAKSYNAGGGGACTPWFYYSNGIYVFDRGNNTSREINVPVFATTGRGQIGLAKPYASSQGYIVLAALDGYLYAYDKNGNLKWTNPGNRSDALYTTFGASTTGTCISNFREASIMFSDFNGDGYAEIVTGDRIFDLETGILLLDCGFLNGTKISNPLVSVTDINGDGKPELVYGGNTYSINITSRTGMSGNSFALMTPSVTDATALTGLPNASVTLTVPIDIDLDGKVDILAYGIAYFYIYDPLTGVVKVQQAIPTADQGYGVPFVGDIDGDKYPEIMYGETSTGRNIIAWNIDGNSSATVKWRKSTSDGSLGTGLTLFDFNQDEKFEILYRDQTTLRIFDGSSQATMDAPLATISCISGTLGEYPVIADVDNDGEAEIVVTGSPSDGTRGYVYIFNAGVGTRWAPARKVWNQYAYNVVNINEDLTVPTIQFDIATIMAGKDHILGTTDDIRPYNGFLKQSTMIDRYGNMVMYTPDASVVDHSFVYNGVGDSLTVMFRITNRGKAALQAPFYFTAYKNAALSTNVIETKTVNKILLPDNTITCAITIYNFSQLSLNSLEIRVNDQGQAAYVQTECDYTTNAIIMPLSTILMAHNDHTATITTTPIKVDVLANDSIPDGCTPTVSVIAPFAKHGTATIVNDSVQYIAAAGFVGYDTVTYSVDCDDNTSTAQVYILVYDKPDNIVEQESCYVPTEPFEFKIKQQWEKPEAGNHYTGTLVGDLDGDGLPEIVAYTSSTSVNSLPSITIYNGQNGMPKDTIFLSSSANGTGGWHPVMLAALVDADRNGLGELIVTDPNGTVKSYKTDTTGGKFNLIPNWESATLFDNPVAKDYFPQPIVADFNSDGVPEVLVYNKIYNAVTGHYLGETEAIATAYLGRIRGRTGNESSNFITAADFDGDGMLEIAAGGKVYKVNFNAAKTAVTCSVWSQHNDVTDGFTAVADVDMDGLLDIVVVSGTPINAVVTATRIQIWTPATKHKFDDINVYDGSNANSVCQGYPFVGDIDGVVDAAGKKYPEICVTTFNRVSAFKYNPSTKQFVPKWTLPTTDTSGGTGITLFDFNNDGINEIVYRDETLLRVLNGVADATPVLVAPGASFECESGTAFEYPVIADTDGDGSANICVTCTVDRLNVSNYLRVYESGSVPWAPTRKVWNQVNYEPLQINEDLTVPQFPIPKNTAFAGKYPYNGALIQVPTMVNEEFTIVQLAPDPAVDAVWVETVDASNLKVCVRIKNLGVKNTNPTLPVALYKGAITPASPVGGTNYITSLPLGAAIAPGDKHTLCFTIANTQLDPQMSVRIQDDGTKFPADGSYLDCDLTNNIGTGGSLLAIRDYVIGDSINPSGFNVLDNDYLASCGKGSLDAFDTVANIGLQHGVLTINTADSSFTYTPAKNFLGVDSVMYYIKCGADSSATKVYILIQNPLSQQYVACPDASVTMGFSAISGVTYQWYNAETGGSIVSGGNSVNTLTITKGSAADIGTWWVEARAGNIVFPRYRVDLETSNNCGITTPQGCAATGTILWKEDFGGNDTQSPQRAPDPGWKAIGRTTYNYVTRAIPLPYVNEYSLLKNIGNGGHYWSHNGLDDHTSWGDTSRGYFLNFDASKDEGEFYNFEIDNLCEGNRLTFTAWLMNINPPSFVHLNPNVSFIVKDMSNNVLSIFNTGDIVITTSPTWVNYSFNFTVPQGLNKVKVGFFNNQTARTGSGNDISIDDIEVRLCAPAVTTNIIGNDTVVCSGNSLDIIGTYIEDCTFGNDLAYFLEFRHVDSVNWKTLKSKNVTIDCAAANPADRTITETISIASASKADEGYYRMSISSSSNIGSVNCRAASDSVYVHVVDKYAAPDLRIQICPSPPNHTVQLSKYLDSTDYNRIEWGQVSPYPVIINLETGLIQDANLYRGNTYTFKYTLRSPEYSGCGESTARVYMRILNNHVFGKTVDTIVICSSLATSRFVNLNRISGLELDGVWSYPKNANNTVTNNITEFVTPSKYAGAVVFNAQKAYADADNSYDVSYKGVSCKAFDFVYIASPPPSCVNVTKRIVLVVTP